MVIFLAICGAMFHNTAVHKVTNALPDIPETEVVNLITGTGGSAFLALSSARQTVVVSQLADALVNVWILFLAAAALSFGLSIPLLVSTTAIFLSRRSDMALDVGRGLSRTLFSLSNIFRIRNVRC